MPAASIETLFGTKDFKLDNKMLGHLAQMCNPDLPTNSTSMISDFAFNEICVGEDEAAKLMDIVHALRTPDQAEYVVKLFSTIKDEAAKKKNKALGQLAESIEAEYTRICKVFFLRSRCIEVSRVSTNEVIGRIVSFPDQVSDAYGNNLEPRSEKGMNPGKVLHSERASEFKGKTLFLGHGLGALMAHIYACLNDEQCIVFDGTFLSEVLAQNFFRDELPDKVKMQPRQEADRPWNILNESLDIVEKRFAAAVPIALKIAKQVGDEHAKQKAEEAEKKKREGKAPSRSQSPKKKKEGPPPAEQAAAFFGKRMSNSISGIIPSGPSERFHTTGHFSANALSNLLSNYMTRVAASEYPFAAAAES